MKAGSALVEAERRSAEKSGPPRTAGPKELVEVRG